MLFQPIFETAACPLPGYDLQIVVLANPTNKVWNDFLAGNTSTDDGRQQLGRALVALYGGKAYGAELDFSTPETALASIQHDDIPDEIVSWLLQLPITVRNQRVAAMEKKLQQPSTAPS